jgi:hypothetical protein
MSPGWCGVDGSGESRALHIDRAMGRLVAHSTTRACVLIAAAFRPAFLLQPRRRRWGGSSIDGSACVRGRDGDPRRPPKCLSRWAAHQIPKPSSRVVWLAGDQTVHVRLHVC